MTVELSPNESLPARSRTFSPEVVKQVHDLLTGANGDEPVRNIGIGTFDSEGQARSALVTLNRLLAEQENATQKYAGTVRATEGDKFKAIVLNRPAKSKGDQTGEDTAPAAPATGGRRAKS